jgi:general secretion pathway protein H
MGLTSGALTAFSIPGEVHTYIDFPEITENLTLHPLARIGPRVEKEMGVTSRTGDVTADGFTLLELLVALVIMGFLLAAAMPLVGGGFQSVSADAAARALATELRTMRRAAIENASEMVLTVDPDTLQYRVSTDNRVRHLPAGLKLSAGTTLEIHSENSVLFRFFRDGSASGGWMILDGKTRQYRIDIDWLSGRVTVNG